METEKDEELVYRIERRARKALGQAGIYKDAKIAVIDPGDCEGAVNAHLIKALVTITKNIVFTTKEPTDMNSYDFLSVPESATTRAEQLLDHMLNNTTYPSKSKTITLLKDSLRSEISTYAKIKSIKYDTKGKKDDITWMVETLQKHNDGTTYALTKAAEQLPWQN